MTTTSSFVLLFQENVKPTTQADLMQLGTKTVTDTRREEGDTDVSASSMTTATFTETREEPDQDGTHERHTALPKALPFVNARFGTRTSTATREEGDQDLASPGTATFPT